MNWKTVIKAPIYATISVIGLSACAVCVILACACVAGMVAVLAPFAGVFIGTWWAKEETDTAEFLKKLGRTP